MNVFTSVSPVPRRHPVISGLITLALVVVLWPDASLRARQPIAGSRVLVMPFAVEVDPNASRTESAALWLGEAASVLLTDGLSSRGIGVVERDERIEVFDRLQLPMSPTLTRATMIRVADIFGASEIVFGEVRLGAKLSVRARMVSVAAGRQLPDVSADADLPHLFELFSTVTEGLAKSTGRIRPVAPTSSPDVSVEVFENYMKGLVATAPAAQRRFLETALSEAPHDGRILTALWSVYSAAGEHEKALAAASMVAADSPLSRKARFAAALSLIELKRFDGAHRALTALQTERPAAAVANALGIAQLQRGSFTGADGAIAHFTRAAEQEAGNTDYLFNTGYAHALAGDAASALFWLREAVRFDAADADAHLVMSAVLMRSGKTVEARREFDLARLLGTTTDPAALSLAAEVPARLERTVMTVDAPPIALVTAAIANPAQRDHQATAMFHLERARKLVEAQNDREAVNELRRTIYLAPYEDEPHLLLGQVYQRTGRLEDAINEYKIAIWARETVAARIALGQALLDAGDRTAARVEAARALQLAPDSAAARALMARIGGEAPRS
jgi:Flp pilus assembly protein TadD/TolB-like protein